MTLITMGACARRSGLLKSREKTGSRCLRMPRPLDKVSPFKIDPLMSELNFTRAFTMDRCRYAGVWTTRPILREDVSTSFECG